MSEPLFGLPDDEQLSSSIEEVTDRFPDGTPLEVTVFRRMKINPERTANWVLDTFLEELDEIYSDPDGNPTLTTDSMRAAARQFVEAVLKEYTVWSCEPTGEVFKTVGTGEPENG